MKAKAYAIGMAHKEFCLNNEINDGDLYIILENTPANVELQRQVFVGLELQPNN